MKWAGFIFFVLFIVTAVLIVVITYVKPPWDITLEDISPAVAPDTSRKEPATQVITLIDSSETDGDDKIQIDYYIIVESFKNLTQAQKRSEELANDFNTNIIVLPPTTEGYYRISYGKYSTLEEAKSAIKSIRTKISSKAWIFSVKK
jgi:hypothetical protein